MENRLTLRIKSALAEIPVANEAASRWLAEHHAPPTADYFANLTIEELVTNCIKYGYDDSEEHTIEVELKLSAAELVVTVTDDGHPFDPLKVPEPDTNLPMEERLSGGLGIHLLRRMSDRMDYARTDGKNRLILRKSLVDGRLSSDQNMNLEYSDLPNGVSCIKLHGSLDMTGVATAEARFHAHCDRNSPRVVVDLSGVDYISSVGIRMLLQAIKTVSSRGGRLVLWNPTKIVDSALDISGLGQYIVRGSEAEASAALVQPRK